LKSQTNQSRKLSKYDKLFKERLVAGNGLHVVDGAGIYTHQYHSSTEVSHGLIFAKPSPWRLLTLLFTLAENLH
jgi:hypothetical protein